MTSKKKTLKQKPKTNTPHDALVKKIMENPIAAGEFLDEYLPISFKNAIDLSTLKLEKESFVEKNLVKQLSDIVLSVKTKNNEQAFVYILLENQVSCDYWISFRLWKYMLLLSERHVKNKEKLPLICPLVFYHGTKKYDAPMNIWQLFTDPTLAKKLLTEDYALVDLQSMSDDDINYDKHLSIMLYMMKHVHQRDKLKLIENIFKHCYKAILIDKTQDYLYTKLMIWYTDSQVPIEKKQELEQLIADKLPKDDNEDIMRTIAQAYIEEGEARGAEKRNIQVAINMLRQNADLKFVAAVTGLSSEQLLKLKHNL